MHASQDHLTQGIATGLPVGGDAVPRKHPWRSTLLRHRTRALVMLGSALLTSADWLIATVVVILDFCVSCVFLGDELPFPFWIVWSSLALLARRGPRWISIVAVTMTGIALVSGEVLSPSGTITSSGLVMLEGTLAASCCAGWWLRSRSVEARRREIDRQERERRLRERTAEGVHAAVTGNLSGAVLHLRNAEDACGNARGVRGDLEETEHLVLRSLEGVRNVMEGLHDESPGRHELQDAGAAEAARPSEVARRGDAQLRGIGFSGRTVLLGQPPGAGSGVLLVTAMREVHANIARHGDPGGSYAVVVECGHRGFSLTSSNTVSREESRLPRSGFGLRSLERAFRAEGGALTVDWSGNVWTISASAPWRGGHA